MPHPRFEKNFYLLDRCAGFLALLAVFGYLLIVASSSLTDLDIWLHLKTGEVIAGTRSIPDHDIFSAVVQGKPWIDHEWLFQALVYGFYRIWQADGLISLQAGLILFLALILYKTGLRTLRFPFETACFVLLANFALRTRVSLRPDVLSLIFFAVFLYILRFKITGRALWCLVFFQILWVNTHGYFFLGPLLMFLFIAAEFIRRRAQFLPRQWRRSFPLSDEAYRRLVMAFIAALAASFLNPRGWEGAMYPAAIAHNISTGSNSIFFKYIDEMRSLFTVERYPAIRWYHFYSGVTLALMIFFWRRLKIVEILLFLTFYCFSLSVRNIAFGVAGLFPVATLYAGGILRKLRLRARARRGVYPGVRIAAAGCVIIFLSGATHRYASQSYYDLNTKKYVRLIGGIDARYYPSGAADFLASVKITGNCFNNFNAGSYLIGRLYPGVKVFIDGRTELYGGDKFNDHMAIMRGDIALFRQMAQKYNLTIAVFGLTGDDPPPVIYFLYKDPVWKLVFYDDTGVVFLKDIPAHKEIIDRYAFKPETASVVPADLYRLGLKYTYPLSYVRRAGLFNAMHEDDLALREAYEALRVMPDCAAARAIIADVYSRRGLHAHSFEYARAALLYQPRNVRALVTLAKALRQVFHDDTTAMRVLRCAVSIDGRYAPAHYELGSLYFDRGDDIAAVRELTEAIALSPAQASYHLKMGEVVFSQARKCGIQDAIPFARQEVAKAREFNIENDEALNARSAALLERMGE